MTARRTLLTWAALVAQGAVLYFVVGRDFSLAMTVNFVAIVGEFVRDEVRRSRETEVVG